MDNHPSDIALSRLTDVLNMIVLLPEHNERNLANIVYTEMLESVRGNRGTECGMISCQVHLSRHIIGRSFSGAAFYY